MMQPRAGKHTHKGHSLSEHFKDVPHRRENMDTKLSYLENAKFDWKKRLGPHLDGVQVTQAHYDCGCMLQYMWYEWTTHEDREHIILSADLCDKHKSVEDWLAVDPRFKLNTADK